MLQSARISPLPAPNFGIEFPRDFRVERLMGLVFPREGEARFAQRVVAVAPAEVAFGEVGSVRRKLIAGDAVFDVFVLRGDDAGGELVG